MDLLDSRAGLYLSDKDLRIYSRNMGRPPLFVGENAKIISSMISEGSRIEGLVSHSVLSGGVRVEEGAEVYDSVIMSDVHIKKGARIYYSIIDSDTVVEENAMVGNKNCDKDNIRVIEKDSRIKAELFS
jgi:glucose-1-phosphate adenylyltransferase